MAIFAFAFTACPPDGDSDDTGSGRIDHTLLNGTWVTAQGVERTFNNGVWEDTQNGVLWNKGAYTVSGGKITLQVTHNHGDYYSMYGLASKWYTKDELLQGVETYYRESGIPEESYSAILVSMNNNLTFQFTAMTVNYTINGNTLVFTSNNGSTLNTFTKK
jgi:hypothetical protein